MKRNSGLIGAIVLLVAATAAVNSLAHAAHDSMSTARTPTYAGELRIAVGDGLLERMPLRHTDVHAEIAGHVARVEVTQMFDNPYDRKIEAVYVFPLPNRAAVNDMEIEVGERTIKGLIKKRAEAWEIYTRARHAGHVAALLDQERPNIFTQSVANVMPGEAVKVTIRYFETLPYTSGLYEFVFPMVVGPRFIPGTPMSAGERGWSPKTSEVPDASRITPPVLPPGHRSGHNISLTVRLDAGTSVYDLISPSHAIETHRGEMGADLISLRPEDSIPNRDFVLRYRIDGVKPNLILLPHRSNGEGYFLALIQPENQPAEEHIAPKEMIFVVDCSGSMSGFPIARVREAMLYALNNLNPLDTFQIISFSVGARSFAPSPVLATSGNIGRAIRYVERLEGRGGTIMLEGVKAAVDYPEDPDRLRIISFMTDGYIGNEVQILAYLKTHLGGARLFSFGVGNSVNRYLLDEMAQFGRGAVDYILLNEGAQDAVIRFYERIRSPYLTEIEIDWGELRVADIYPPQVPDLFLGQPVVLYGRYEGSGQDEITLRGRLGGKPYTQRIHVNFPAKHEEGEAIGALWARSRIAALSSKMVSKGRPEIVEEITNIALKHHLVSRYTSFVAVEWATTTGEQPAEMIEVPAELPEGVSYEGVFGGVTTFSSEFIDSLPVLGRNYQEVLTLAPGVSDTDGDGQPNIHGALDTDVKTLVDHVSTVDPLTGQAGEQLDIESIQEVEVKTAGASAEFSRGQGGFVNIETEPDGSEGGVVGGIVSGVVGGVVGGVLGGLLAGIALETTDLVCRLEIDRRTYRLDKLIELTIIIDNKGEQDVLIPADLSMEDGTARFSIIDDASRLRPHPMARTDVLRKRLLAPGEKATFKVVLNASGGYEIERPGQYRITFMGTDLGLPDSNTLSIVIEP